MDTGQTGTTGGTRPGFAAVGGSLLLVVAMLALAFVPGFARPAAAQDDEGQALVRFVHASPDAPAVDVYVGDEVALPGSEFGGTSDYFGVPAGDRQIRVVPTGQLPEAALVDLDGGLEDGRFYEVAVVGLLNDIEGRLYEVNTDQIEEPGAARLRVIHVSPDAGEIDIAETGGEVLFEGAEFPDAADYRDLPAGPIDLETRPGGEESVIASTTGLQLEAGTVYDVFVIGQASNQTLQMLPLATPAAQPCTDVLGVGVVGDGCLRVVHASPGAPNVDVYVDDATQPAVADLPFGEATEYVALTGGEHQIRVVATGGAPDAALIDQNVEVEGGQAYEIAALNVPDDIEAQVYEVDLSPLPADQARVRVVHASPDAGDVDIAVTGGEVLFEGAGFPDATSYREVTGSTYDLEVRPAGEEDVTLRAQGTTLEPGSVYDIFAVGENADSLQLITLTAPAAGSAGAVGPATPAASPEAEGVDQVEPTPGAPTPPPATPAG